MNSPAKTPNRLISESSPYLLQHAYNPVDWFPWGDEAFDKAKRENKPVFLSVGYSTCHWCHVMERESFEDEGVARLLNDYFVPVKVDREERPDVDGLYMRACQAMTGGGGWPLTVLITPDGKPFHAGTYLPKNTRRGMYGLTELLTAVRMQWNEDASALLRSADEFTGRLKKSTERVNARTVPDLTAPAVEAFKSAFDNTNGGFGRAPKFPCPHNLLFLARRYEITGDEDALDMVKTTLTQMYRGGLFDQIGYGFSRYSTDARWFAPHFEKMLYDNALLLLAYARAYGLTRDAFYKDTALKIFKYVNTELAAPDGGFYCAQDADSDGGEGAFYLFTPAEIAECLGEADGGAFCRFYDVTENGNFEGRNIPNLLLNSALRPPERIAAMLPKLRDYRKQRAELHLDDKILTSWNALTAAALAAAYRELNEKTLLAAAEKTLAFISEHLTADGEIYAVFRGGKRGPRGFLDDHAFLIWAYIEIFQSTCDGRDLDSAASLFNKTVEMFFDRENGGFFTSGGNNERLIINIKETYDGALPSGNSVMAYNAEALALLRGEDGEDGALKEVRRKHRAYMDAAASDYPEGHSFYLLARLLEAHTPADFLSCKI